METGIYGWQARLGYAAPSPLLNTPYEFWKLAPDGIAMVSTGLHVSRRFDSSAEATRQEVIAAVGALDPFGLDGISIGLGPFVFAHGSAIVSDLRRQMSGITPAPIFFDCEAILESLASLKARRLSILSPYGAANDRRLAAYFQDEGLEIAQVVSHPADSDPTEGGRLVEPVRSELSNGASDAIYIAGDAWRVAQDIPSIERDLGRPVVTDAQALLWSFLRRMHIRSPLANCGQLLAS
jgi:maleate cis-trans isomerase